MSNSNRKKNYFNEKLKQLLISENQLEEFLWDKKHYQYKDNKQKDEAWVEIAKTLNLPRKYN